MLIAELGAVLAKHGLRMVCRPSGVEAELIESRESLESRQRAAGAELMATGRHILQRDTPLRNLRQWLSGSES